MKMVSWNVNSVRSREELIGRFLDAEEPDVLCIQELKAEDHQVPLSLFESRGYNVASYGQKRWNGVLIAAKHPINQVQRGFPGEEGDDSRMIAAQIASLNLVNLYCPQGQTADSPKFQYKLRFFSALLEWMKEHADPKQPWIFLGDINIAPEARDLWDPIGWENTPTFHPAEREKWQQLIDWGLRDVMLPFLSAESYSFWDYRMLRFPKNQGLRIDHFLATAVVEKRVVGAKIHRDWRKKRGQLKASDHAPVEIELQL